MPPALPRNADLAERFELLADLLELDGADAFRLAAYRRAAARIRESAVSVAQLAIEGKATQLSGIGGTIQAKIVELAKTGDLQALAKLRDRLPVGLVEVMHVPGLGPKTARKLWVELGIGSQADLRAAAEQGRLRAVPGLGAKTEENLLAFFARPARPASRDGRVLLGRALPFVEAVVEDLRSHPAAVRVSEAGSVRRRAETVRDLDVIATATDAGALIEYFLGRPWVAEVAASGQTKATVVSHDGLRLDLRVVPPECFGNLLQHFTGSKDHNVALREDAVRHGLSVSEYGVETVAIGKVATHESEEELYAYLGYAWIPPELRENSGELEAARAGELPALVERSEVIGDLHVHSDWSDGKAPLEDMVAAAAALGHRYLAVCDHAKRLRDGRLERQAERIDALNARFPELRILSGVEVDIRADGSLDLDEEALARRDWVVASIHGGFHDPPAALTRRLLAAIEHPHVDCIGHPTGRKIGRRAPYDVDLEAIFDRAAETGTCLEINGQPDRLDLRDAHARAADRKGVRIVVSSDAHSVAGLGFLDLAVYQARRAWLTAAQVANTRPWEAFVKERRR
jgi:DNA polymerase (family 10)